LGLGVGLEARSRTVFVSTVSTTLLRRLSLFALVLAPLLASAQAVTLRRSVDTTATPYTFGVSECDQSIEVAWTYNALFVTGYLCQPLTLWMTSGSCAESMGANDVKAADDIQALVLQTAKQGVFTVKVSALPGFATTLADGGTQNTCGSTGISKTQYICGSVGMQSVGVATCTKQSAGSLQLIYDTEPPIAPTIVSQTGEDGAASISFSASSDTSYVQLEMKGPADADFNYVKEVAASASLVRVENLVNGQPYQLRLRALDAAKNQSPPTDPVTVTPIKTSGFFGQYREQGGTEQGGCSAAGAALIPFAALALARAFARRSRRS
jgi:hypothetical protein